MNEARTGKIVDIQSQDFPEQGLLVLGEIEGVAGVASVSQHVVEVIVERPEQKPSGMVRRIG